MTLERGDDGRWQVRGLPASRRRRPLEPSKGWANCRWSMAAHGARASRASSDVPRIDLRLRVDAPACACEPGLDAGGCIPGPRGAGLRSGPWRRASWASLREGDLEAWSALRVAGVAPVSGTGSVSAWATLEGHRVTAVTAEAALDGVHLATATASANGSHAFGRIDARARWTALKGGWRFDAPRLRFGAGAEAQVLDGLVVAGGDRVAVLADQVDAGGLLALASLDARMPAGLRDWVRRASPDAVLRQLEVVGVRGGPLRATVNVEDLRIAANGNVPGIAGLSGRLAGDAEGFAFTLDPAADVVFDWPQASVRRTRWNWAARWRVGAKACDGTWVPAASGSTARLRRGCSRGAAVPGRRSRPVVDLALEVDRVALPWPGVLGAQRDVAQGDRMADAALVGGHVDGARALLAGDLDDWPFRGDGGGAATGVFKAEARLDQAEVRFQPGWPSAARVDGTAVFANDGFQVVAATELAGIPIPEVSASVDHYVGGTLQVAAAADTDAAPLLTLLRRSPLHAEHGETLDALRAKGRVGHLRIGDAVAAERPGDAVGDVPCADDAGRHPVGCRLRRRAGLRALRSAGFTADDLQVVRDASRPPRSARGAGTCAMARMRLRARWPSPCRRATWSRGRHSSHGLSAHGGSIAMDVSVAIPRAARGAAETAGRLELRSTLVGRGSRCHASGQASAQALPAGS